MKKDSTDKRLDGYIEQTKIKEHVDNLHNMRRIQARDSCVQALDRAQLTRNTAVVQPASILCFFGTIIC
jgi:hypothetical protein